MLRRGVALALPAFLALAAVVPLAARAASTPNGSTINTYMSLLMGASLAGKSLKPGSYAVAADDSKVTFKMDGKMMAEASIQWKDGTTKPPTDRIVTDGDRIREIHFRGKTRYAEVME
jgi:hypothetical protein